MNEKDKTTRNDVSKNKRSLEQIPIKFDSNSQLREFVSFIKSKGYKLLHGLDQIEDDEKIVAVVVDTEEKTLSTTSVTIMACWCNFVRHPLTTVQFIQYYDEFVINKNLKFYNELIEENGRKQIEERLKLQNK